MEVEKILAELREELVKVEEAIIALARLSRGRVKRRGRPPSWLSPRRKPARPEKRTKSSPKDASD